MTRADLLAFLRSCRYAVESSTHSNGTPQSAVVGVAVSDDFEIVFDTVNTSRKAQNLSQRGGIAFAFGDLGLHQGRTVQLEGVADQPEGAERARLTALYYTVFPDG